jgi:hypothetical protein
MMMKINLYISVLNYYYEEIGKIIIVSFNYIIDNGSQCVRKFFLHSILHARNDLLANIMGLGHLQNENGYKGRCYILLSYLYYSHEILFVWS